MAIKLYPTEKDQIKVPRFEESAGFYTTKQRSKTMSKMLYIEAAKVLKIPFRV